jgi:hypothetical protein
MAYKSATPHTNLDVTSDYDKLDRTSIAEE